MLVTFVMPSLWEKFEVVRKKVYVYHKGKKQQMNVSEEYGCRNPQNMLADQIQQYIKGIIHHDQMRHTQECKFG